MKVEPQEALDGIFARLTRLEQERFEAKQAVMYLGFFVLIQLIEHRLIDRDATVSALDEFAKTAAERCAELGGDGRLNPALAELSDALRSRRQPIFEVIDGGIGHGSEDS